MSRSSPRTSANMQKCWGCSAALSRHKAAPTGPVSARSTLFRLFLRLFQLLDPLVDQLTLVGQILARRPQLHPLKLVIYLLGLFRILLGLLTDQPGQYFPFLSCFFRCAGLGAQGAAQGSGTGDAQQRFHPFYLRRWCCPVEARAGQLVQCQGPTALMRGFRFML